MALFKKTEFFEADYYKRWEELDHPALKEYRKAEVDFLKKCAKGAVLDVGCGTGRLLNVLMGLGQVSKAFGIDFANAQLSDAKKLLGGNAKSVHDVRNEKKLPEGGPKVLLARANAEQLPFPDNTFDQVICMGNTYGILERKMVCLGEMMRVAKQEGEVILSVYSQEALLTQLETYALVGLEYVDMDLVTVMAAPHEIAEQIQKLSESDHLKRSAESIAREAGISGLLMSQRFTKDSLKKYALKFTDAEPTIKELTDISLLARIPKSTSYHPRSRGGA